MADRLVDRMLHDILGKQAATPVSTGMTINRPNYQREKGQLRRPSGQYPGTLPVMPLVNRQPYKGLSGGDTLNPGAPDDRAKPSSELPAGTLFVKALGSQVPPLAPQLAATNELLSEKGAADRQQGVWPAAPVQAESAAKVWGQAQFIGTAAGGTCGYVIPNLDSGLWSFLGTSASCRAIGVISSRCGAAAQVMAVDEAVKQTHVELVRLELARDEQGGTGHGVFVLFGADDVADVMSAVKIAIEATEVFQQNVCRQPAGKIEVHYSARAAMALNTAFGATLNQAFGLMIGAPAGVGFLMGDTALKTALVQPVLFRGPSAEQAFANEFWLAVSGESAAVKNALDAAKTIGSKVLAEFPV